MSFITEEAEFERMVINDAYDYRSDSVFYVVAMIVILLLVGCLVVAFITLRKPAKKTII